MVNIGNLGVSLFSIGVPLVDFGLVIQEAETIPLEELGRRGVLSLKFASIEHFYRWLRI